MVQHRPEGDLHQNSRDLLEQTGGSTLDLATVELAKRRLETFATSFQAASEATRAVSEMVSCVAECVRVRLELDAFVRQCEVDASYRLDKLRLQTPVIERQLQRMSEQVDKLLDRALAIDTRACSREDLELRAQLLRYAQGVSQQLGDTLIRYMLI